MKSTFARVTSLVVFTLLLLTVTSALMPVRTYAALPPSAASAVVPVGPFPISLGYSPVGGYVYVGSFTSGVSVISGTRVVGNMSSNDIGYIPRAFAYDSSNHDVYVAGGDRLSLISGTHAVANGPNGGATPQTVVYDPSDDYVFVANLGSIVVLSSNNTLVANLTTYTRPGGFVYDPLDDYTYASYIMQNVKGAQTGTEVYVMSGARLVGNVTLASGGGGFVPPVYDACRNYVYLANTNLGSVSAIWGTTLVGAVPVGPGPAALAYDDSNHYVYVANSNAGTVSVLSGTTVVGNVAVGSTPNAIAYNPHDGYVYVVNGGSGTVSVISGTTLMATVGVGKNPVAIIYNPSNNYMYVANNGEATVSVVPSLGPAVNNGSSSDCTPIRAAPTKTTTTVTCATPVTVGAPSLCSVKVAGFGTPSGKIGTFTSTGPGTFDATSCTLSGGSCTVHYAPASASGSPHLISAAYGGDTKNDASTATGANLGSVTVNQATTTTSVSCSSPVAEGMPSTCTATVSGAYGTIAGEMASFIASGSGSFDATSCALSLESCTVHYTPTNVAGSSQTITAAYPGDADNAGSSGIASITSNRAAATTALSCSSPVSVGTPSICTATVSGASGSTNGEALLFAASGSGDFSSGGTCTLSAGSCSLTYTPTSASESTQTIAASYPGDTSNAGSSGTAAVTVNKASTTTAVNCASPVKVGTPSTCSVTVTGHGTPSGSVSFEASGSGASSSVGTCALGGGTCSVTFTPTSVPSSPTAITATYSGDTDNAGSAATSSITATYSGDANNAGTSSTTTSLTTPATSTTSALAGQPTSSTPATSATSALAGQPTSSTPALSTWVLFPVAISVVLAGIFLVRRRRSRGTGSSSSDSKDEWVP